MTMTTCNKWGLAALSVALAGIAASTSTAHAQSVAVSAQTYDYVIIGGTVVDGTGQPGYRADVGIVGDRIVKIGELGKAQARHRIDATGRVIIPGFIDLHGHSDDQQGHWRGLRSPDPQRRAAVAQVSQGITTSAANPDGLAPSVPIREQIAMVDGKGIGLNVAYMVSHPRVRYAAMGDATTRPANASEIEKMRAMIREDMESGAWGMTSTLESRDGTWSTTEELIAVTKALQEYDGAFVAHPRSQSQKPWWWVPSQENVDKRWAPTMFEASEELIRISAENGIRVSMSHFTMRGPDPNRDVKRTVDAVNAARARGAKVYADMFATRSYPLGYYTPLLPAWALRPEPEAPTFFRRPTAPREKVNYQDHLKLMLADPARRKDIETDAAYLIEHSGGAARITVTEYPDRNYVGKTLAELAQATKLTPVQLVIKMGLEGDPNFPGGARTYGIDGPEADKDLLVSSDWVTGCTDGYLTRPGDPGYLDPRFYGAYPEWIKTYVLDRKTVKLEFAVRSLTRLAAEIVGIKDRGMIKEGMAADLSVVDLATLAPQSTIHDIHRFSTGFDHVFVNGVPVVSGSKVTWALPGKVLRRPAATAQARTSPRQE
jgi:N-acyl-D-amino-acid deacylase